LSQPPITTTASIGWARIISIAKLFASDIDVPAQFDGDGSEEMIRAQPMDAVVVIGGCDKTLPAQIMAAVSADLPTVVIPVGPMVVGHHKGEVLGACTDCRRLWGKYRAGEIDDVEIEAVNGRLAPSVGTCMVMGNREHHGLHHRGARPVAADECLRFRRRMRAVSFG